MSNVRITFLGAAQCVTGSKYLLEVNRHKILIDCGLFQGTKELRRRNWDDFPIPADQIDCVVLTHAHLDHTGYLPRLMREGFKGKIHCTEATEDLTKIILLDAGKLQEEEALFAFKRGYSKHDKPEPLFSKEDVKSVFPHFIKHPMSQWARITDNVRIRFHRAGHILGSSFIEMEIEGKTETKKIVFSGDLGRTNDPIMRPPHSLVDTDILLIESTYGNRVNPAVDKEDELEGIVAETLEKDGCLLIPAFAIGRTQNLIYHLHKLMRLQRILTLPIFVDSPMATSVTDLYEKYPEDHTIEVTHVKGKLMSIFDAPNIHFIKSTAESKALNARKKPCIIISASGMATGGRILHHLFHRLSNAKDTVLLAGYQVEGSRGRRLLDGEPTLRMFGEDVPVKCAVRQMTGLSAHADQTEILAWLSTAKQIPKQTFITHGEKASAFALGDLLQKSMGWSTTVPAYQDTYDLFKDI